MKRYLIVAAAAVAALVGALEIPTTRPAVSSAATQPATLSTTRPTTQFSRDYSRRDDRYSRSSNGYPVQRLRDTPYSLLESRSIFYKGRFTRSDENRTTGPVGPTSRPADSIYTAAERNLVFEGTTDFDEEYVAFIEDFNGGKIQMLHSGDAIAGGKIGTISLDYIDFIDKSGKTTRVPLGKNLEGIDPPTTRPSYLATSTESSGPTTSLSAPGGVPQPGMDALMAKLKARRQAEGGN